MSVTRCAGETAVTGSWAQQGARRSCRGGTSSACPCVIDAPQRSQLRGFASRNTAALSLKLHRVLRVERDRSVGGARRAVLVQVEVALAPAVAEAEAIAATAVVAEAGTAGVTKNQLVHASLAKKSRLKILFADLFIKKEKILLSSRKSNRLFGLLLH